MNDTQTAKTSAQKRIAFGDRAPLIELAAVFPELSVTGMVNAHWHVAYLCLAQMAQGLCYFAAGKILSQPVFFWRTKVQLYRYTVRADPVVRCGLRVVVAVQFS